MQQELPQFTFMKSLITSSSEETKQLAADLAVRQAHRKPLVLALIGELGSGKTTFVQGFAKGLGIKDSIISPTFVIIRQHKNIYHVDLYRLEGFKELGLEEILANPNNIVLIEWAEKLKNLPKNTIRITIKKLKNDKRLITIE